MNVIGATWNRCTEIIFGNIPMLDIVKLSQQSTIQGFDSFWVSKINRFVFLKNSPEPTPVTSGAAVTPAGGSNPVQK